MSTLTLRLTEEELRKKLDDIKTEIGHATDSGAIKYLIDNYLKLSNNIDILNSKLVVEQKKVYDMQLKFHTIGEAFKIITDDNVP